MKKVKSKSDPIETQAVQFIRDHVALRLQKIGFSQSKACELCDCVSDEEWQEFLPKVKMRGIGGGNWLTWLQDHKSDILDGVEKAFNLLGLIAPFLGTKPKTEEPEEKQENDEEEESEEEDQEDEEEESEDEDQEDDSAKKRR